MRTILPGIDGASPRRRGPRRSPGRHRSRPGRCRRALPLLALLALAGCGSAQGPAAQRGGRTRPLVLTSVAPVTLLTRAVAGDCAEVRPLLPPGAGPHGYESSPQDLLALRRARVLVINGLGLESFLDPLRRAAANRSLRVIDSSRGVPVLAGLDDHGHDHGPQGAPDPGPQGRHDPDLRRGHDDGPKGARAHAPQAGHAHGGEGGPNPHIWLDPQRAERQVITIRDGLIGADPACAPTYRRQAAATVAQLRRLDGEIAALLRPYRGRTFVVFHDFAPYFAERYGLRAEHLVASPELAASPADLRRVSEAVRRSGIRVLLRPPGESSPVLENLARDLGIQVASFSPMETLTAAELADPDSYVRIQRGNAEALQRAFSP